MVYNSLGILQNREEIWMKRLEEVKKYIDENGKRPSYKDKIENIKKLGKWIGRQVTNYIKKENIMFNNDIYNKWTEFINDEKYKQYFMSNEELWNEKFNQVKKYIDDNNEIPFQKDINIRIRQLGEWIGTQTQNYKKIEHIMINDDIYNKWTEFINDEKYKQYFMSNEELWNEKFNQVKKYIDNNNKRPLYRDKNENIKKLGVWISSQQNNYKKKDRIMSNNDIYNKWTEFINDDYYKLYFMSNEELWNGKFNQVKKYIDENNKRPSKYDKNTKIKKLGMWFSNSKTFYKNKLQIMKNQKIYNKWTEFINDEKYKQYF